MYVMLLFLEMSFDISLSEPTRHIFQLIALDSDGGLPYLHILHS